MIHTRCLKDDDLVAMAFDAGAPDPYALQHVSECDGCEDRLVGLLHAVRGLTVAASAFAPADPCLTDGQLAELARGAGAPDQEAWSHLAACAGCSGTLAELVRLLGDPQVDAQVQQLESPRSASPRRTTFRTVAGAATLAAAVVAGLILRPDAMPDRAVAPEAAPHRQSPYAAEITPRIVAPTLPGEGVDTLRWTSVPFADRYQVLMFDREGTLAWESQTRDTAIALPLRLRTEAAVYLWKVEARTDWNHWVASEWAELAIPPRP